ncbi:MAG: hypothetical protein M9894_40125 [Planctomycetes bacterium]|nr:hypothetical protein [Planctomycetota bacterium]
MTVGTDAAALRSMPPEVQSLRDGWPSRQAEIPGLTDELEQEFRFGQRVTKTERGFMMGGSMKGGSSSMWCPVSRDQYRAFRRWQGVEGVLEGRDDEAFARLTALLARHEVELVTKRRSGAPGRRAPFDPEPFPGYGPLYGDMERILSLLPPEHLSRPELRRLQLGGWGPDAAKASAYVEQDGAVVMYDFACRGARRTFLGLFLHELGHAHECALPDAEKDAIHAHYQVLSEEDAFFGVEFLVDALARRLTQRFVFEEFLAEVYMIYTACGGALRAMIAGLPERPRLAWEQVYARFRASFGGVEYA